MIRYAASILSALALLLLGSHSGMPQAAAPYQPVLAWVQSVPSASAFTLDAAGNVFVAETSAAGVIVEKRNALATTILYRVLLHGTSEDTAHGMVTDRGGNLYITGVTSAPDFPTRNAVQPQLAKGVTRREGRQTVDAFVTKLDPSGAIIYSTYLGGSQDDFGTSIAVDSAGLAYVTGTTYSTDFPLSSNPLQASHTSPLVSDAFVTKLSPEGNALLYSTYLGGSGPDEGQAIAVDATGNATIAGTTQSGNLPVTAHAFGRRIGGNGEDVFVTRIAPDGRSFVYSSFLGGNINEHANGVAVDGVGNAYVAGWTLSANFPTVHSLQKPVLGGQCDAFDGPGNLCTDAFVTKINPAGSRLLYSTPFGGKGNDIANGITVDRAGNATLVGGTSSTDFPILHPIQGTYGGGQCKGEARNERCWDGFIVSLSPQGALRSSSYLGGSRDDGLQHVALSPEGNPTLLGATTSSDFPMAGGLQSRTTSQTFIARVQPNTSTRSPSIRVGRLGLYRTVNGKLVRSNVACDGDRTTFALRYSTLGSGYIAGGVIKLYGSGGGRGQKFLVRGQLAGGRPALLTTRLFDLGIRSWRASATVSFGPARAHATLSFTVRSC